MLCCSYYLFFYNSDELQCDLDMIVKPDNRFAVDCKVTLDYCNI